MKSFICLEKVLVGILCRIFSFWVVMWIFCFVFFSCIWMWCFFILCIKFFNFIDKFLNLWLILIIRFFNSFEFKEFVDFLFCDIFFVFKLSRVGVIIFVNFLVKLLMLFILFINELLLLFSVLVVFKIFVIFLIKVFLLVVFLISKYKIKISVFLVIFIV